MHGLISFVRSPRHSGRGHRSAAGKRGASLPLCGLDEFGASAERVNRRRRRKPVKQALRQIKSGLMKLGVIAQPAIDETQLPLYDIYEDTFEVMRADTPELREAAYRLRFQVYCVEREFMDPARNHGGMEIDEYDERSVQTLLFHRQSGMLVGNVRLVLPDPRDLHRSFPMQSLVSADWLRDAQHVERSCEISRFCISRSFRRREEDGLYSGIFLGSRAKPPSLFTKAHRRHVIPLAPVGLMRGIIDMALDHGITWGYALLESQMICLLRRMGIESELLGPAIAHHGAVWPVRLDPLRISESVKSRDREIWKVLTDDGRLIRKMESLVSKYRADHAGKRPRK